MSMRAPTAIWVTLLEPAKAQLSSSAAAAEDNDNSHPLKSCKGQCVLLLVETVGKKQQHLKVGDNPYSFQHTSPIRIQGVLGIFKAKLKWLFSHVPENCIVKVTKHAEAFLRNNRIPQNERHPVCPRKARAPKYNKHVDLKASSQL